MLLWPAGVILSTRCSVFLCACGHKQNTVQGTYCDHFDQFDYNNGPRNPDVLRCLIRGFFGTRA